MKTKHKLLLASLFCSILITGCASKNNELKFINQTKEEIQNVQEASFYANVKSVKEIKSDIQSKKKKNKLQKLEDEHKIYELVLEGERGTIVTVQTNEVFDVNDYVLFKMNKKSKEFKLIRVPNVDVTNF
jgi:lipoprotein